MRRNNKKKGFTIVELIIVIAVIGILAAVMIPTFAGVIDNAKEKAALQEATNAYKEAYALAIADGAINKIESPATAGGDTTTVGYYEVQSAGDLFFVFVSANGSIENLNVGVYNADPTTGESESDKITINGETITYPNTNGTIDGYCVVVNSGKVEVHETKESCAHTLTTPTTGA